ncbi:MAG: diacylglycerol/lipid kinase family protein [Flavobacteriales bacterium]
MSLVFIVKSSIRRKSAFYQLAEEFRSYGLFEQIEIRETERHQHAVTLAFQAAREGFQYVIAVGGDGTLNEVINGVMAHKETLSVIGFLPFGSANDFSRSLPCFYSAAEIAEAIRVGKFYSCDLGFLNSVDLESKTIKNWFVNVFDAGIGAVVVKKINRSQKWLGARIAYAQAIFTTFLTYAPSEARILIDGTEYKKKIMTIVVANGKGFGNGLIIAPDSKLDDGKFDIIIIGNVGVFQYLKYISRIRKGEKVIHPEVIYLCGKQLSIEPVGHSLMVEYDGEFGGYAPASVDMHRSAIKLLIPVESNNSGC